MRIKKGFPLIDSFRSGDFFCPVAKKMVGLQELAGCFERKKMNQKWIIVLMLGLTLFGQEVLAGEESMQTVKEEIICP